MKTRLLGLLGMALAISDLFTTAANDAPLVTPDTRWSYLDNGSDQGAAWRMPGFDDSAWPSGRPLFGLEESGLYPWPFATILPVGGGRITYYFRTHFDWTGPLAGAALKATCFLDDGAVFYLNGVECGRVRVADDPVRVDSLAQNKDPEGGAEALNLFTDNLLAGDNVLAVEVHQASSNSSDIVFGMALDGLHRPAIVQQPRDVTVREGQTATFGVTASGTLPLAFQWARNGVEIPGATNAIFSLSDVQLPDDGATFTVVINNAAGSATSQPATLHVVPDVVPPALALATADCASNKVTVTFSERVEANTAGEFFNYTISGGATVQSATALPDGRTVCLFTDPLGPGVTYTLTVENVQDLAGNVVAPNTAIEFACGRTNCLEFSALNFCPSAASLAVISNQLIVQADGTNDSGVSVALGRAKSWEVALEALDAGTLPTGARVEALTEGRFNGTNDFPIARTRLEGAGSQWEASFDFTTIGAPSYTVEVRSNGMVLDRQTGVSGPAARFAEGECEIVDPINKPPPCTPVLSLAFPTPTPVAIPGHAAVVGDEIRAFPDEGPPAGDLKFFSRFELRTTGVPAFRVLRATATPLVLFAGLEHSPLGQAQLALVSNQLAVTNLLTNGSDGVEFELGRVQGFVSHLELPLDTMTAGATLTVSGHGRVGGLEEQSTGALTLQRVAGGLEVQPNVAALGAATYELRIFDGDRMVLARPEVSGAAARITASGRHAGWCELNLDRSAYSFARTAIQLGDGTILTGDSIVAVPESAARRIESFASGAITTAGLGEFALTDAQIKVFDRPHRAVGDATLYADGTQLAVSNLGTNGADGVEAILSPARAWEVVTARLRAAELPTGARLVSDTYGVLAGASNEQLVARTRIEDAGSALQVSFDFSAVGASNYTVEVRLQGALVDSATGVVGPAATIEEGDIIDPVGKPWLDCPPACVAIAGSVGSTTPTTITLPGHAPVTGDRIVAYPTTAAGTPDYFTRFVLRGAHLGTFAIRQENVTTARPVITTQPASLSVTQGASVVLTAAAQGVLPLFYQWRLNGADIAGATNATLQISPATSASAGFYTLVVSNSLGWTESAAGGLRVLLTAPCCDNKSWFQQVTYPNSTPAARTGHDMAYHEVSGHTRLVMFGGEDGSSALLNDTWEWSGLAWFKVTPFEFNTSSPQKSPTPRRDHALAFDPQSGGTVLFGGFNGIANKADTWQWNGLIWVNKTPGVNANPAGPSPSARRNHAMAYDAANNVIVLFGGHDGAINDETWLWNGTSWTLASPANRPPARQNHAMAFDANRNRIVLFGGDDVILFNDTWEWDGVDWQPAPPSLTLPPAPRRGHAMAYDADCGRIRVFGGETPGPSGELWERDGTEWTLVTRLLAPSGRGQVAGAFHGGVHQFLVFGGATPALSSETWTWGFERINNGVVRNDVVQEGVPRDMWGRELTTRRFSWKKVGTVLNLTKGQHEIEREAWVVSDPGNTKQMGSYPGSGGQYTQKKAKNKCNDDFTDCPSCTSGCMPDNSDCRWHFESVPVFSDYALSGSFCNPVYAQLEFFHDGDLTWNARRVGTLRANSSDSDYFVSPAVPALQNQLLSCRQDRHSSQSGYTPHRLVDTINGKEGRVDTQWLLSRVGCGISTGLNPLDPQCTGGGAGGLSCQIQYFEFAQIESKLRFELSILGQTFDPRDRFCFYVDADNDANTGSPAPPECGADYRICTFVYTNAEGQVSRATTLECYNPCLDPVWQPQANQPFDVRLGQTVLEVSVLLSAVGNPQGVYSAWAVSERDGVLCDTQPANVCNVRMQLTRKVDLICPRVVAPDTYNVTGLGQLTAPVRVLFSEAMQPFSVADVMIVPPLPFSVSQDPITGRVLFIQPIGAWTPGRYEITLLPTIQDLEYHSLDGNKDTVCGDPFTFEFCVPDPYLKITDATGDPAQTFPYGAQVYVLGLTLPASSTFPLYLVSRGNADRYGERLADWSHNGPDTVTTSASGSLGLTSVGTPLLTGRYQIVADVNNDGFYDAADRVFGVCGGGVRYGEPCHSTLDDVVAWWPFEEATPALAGELVEANHGVRVGSGSSPAPGVVAQARQFTGGTYLSVADDSSDPEPSLNFGTDDFSIEAWINTSASSGEVPIVDKRSLGANYTGYYLRLLNGELSFLMRDLGGGPITYLASGFNVADGQWHHVAVTVRRPALGTQLVRLFVDGVVRGTGVPALGSLDNTDELRIGGNRAGDPPVFFVGLMDELTFYERALEVPEVQFVFGRGGEGKCTDGLTPQFSVQPTDQTVTSGGYFTLAVSVSSSIAFTVQWFQDGVPIAGATNTTLTISNVSFAMNGRVFEVVVANFAGSATSARATLTVEQPRLTVTRRAGGIELSWSGEGYRLQQTSSLTPPIQWSDVTSPAPIGVGGMYSVELPEPAGTRFYRLEQRP